MMDHYGAADAAHDDWSRRCREAAPYIMERIIRRLPGFRGQSPRRLLGELLSGAKPSRTLATAVADWHAAGRPVGDDWARELASSMDDEDLDEWGSYVSAELAYGLDWEETMDHLRHSRL